MERDRGREWGKERGRGQGDRAGARRKTRARAGNIFNDQFLHPHATQPKSGFSMDPQCSMETLNLQVS